MDGPVRYAFDAKASQFTVTAFASGLAAVVAHNPKFAIRDFSGEAQFSRPGLEKAAVRLSITPSGFELMDEVSEYDRREIYRVMFEEVLETSRYSEISYRSSDVVTTKVNENLFRANISGKLTLHGESRSQAITAQVVAGEDTLRAYGDFTIRQTEFGITIASVAGGTLKMKDELRFAFFIIGRR